MNGVGVGRGDAPPVEDLTVGQVTLPTENEFVVHVQNSGPSPVTLEQVVVNDALWDFQVEPSNRIPRLGSAEVVIPYTWVEGEAYEIVLISETGTTFDAEVPVAVLTPGFSGETFSSYALIGFYVGVVPVTLGLLWYPFLRRLGTAGYDFVLALTVGLLVFLALDTLLEAVEIAGELPGAFSGCPWLSSWPSWRCSGSSASNDYSGADAKRRAGSRLLPDILGIGLHNLGEGLAIGAAFALGETALGDLLDPRLYAPQHYRGVGIAAPVLRRRGRPWRTSPRSRSSVEDRPSSGPGSGASPTRTSSLPSSSPSVGAILRVVYEVARLLMRDSARSKTPALSGTNLGGLTAGIAIMYATALLVSV